MSLPRNSVPVENRKSLGDLFLEEDVLELLLTENLLGLLTSSNEVRHNLFCRTIREILVDLEVFLSKLPGDLVREGFELAESHSVVLDVPLEDLLLCFFYTACIV